MAELARSLAGPAEGAAVGTVQPEDPHLEVAAIGHEDVPVRPERHAGHAAELVGRSRVGQALGSDGDHRGEARRGRGARVGDVDDPVDRVEGGDEVAGGCGGVLDAGGGEGGGQEGREVSGCPVGGRQLAGHWGSLVVGGGALSPQAVTSGTERPGFRLRLRLLRHREAPGGCQSAPVAPAASRLLHRAMAVPREMRRPVGWGYR